jgi:hypothetical protein
MAFRMTRPTIQGTEYHKASVLKAKAETVAQTRTAADPTLVAAGSELGRSYIPKATDFTIKQPEIKIPEGDGKKKKGQSLDERLEKAEQGGETEEQYYNGMMDQILEKVPKKKKVQDKEYISPEPNQEDIDYAEELKRRSEELSAKRKLDNSTRLDPKPIRPLPTTKAKEELFEATGSVDNYIYQQGRFEKAAEEFGFNISQEKINHVVKRETVDADGNTVIKEVGKRLETDEERDQRVRKNYEAAREAMKYNDPGVPPIAAEVLLRAKEGWQKPGVREGEMKPGTIITPEQQAQADKDAKNQAEVDKMNAEKLAEIDAREARKEKDYQDRLRKAQEEKDQKAKELEEKNKAIREQNKAIVEAKKFYGITGDGKLTQPQLDKYQNMRILQAENEAKYQQNPIEIEEESDPDFIQKPTQVEPSTQSTVQATTKPKLSDFKDGKNAFGGHMSKNQAYDEAMKKWRRENPNPIQMRDDAIYKNAIKDGIVQKNMIKSGYKPLD